MERAPNTEYILSLSYGKDSLACLEAIKRLGYPLDRVIHAEVWATDTIPADLPPMVEFKKYADQVILDRYGIVVEHICATRAVERERERERVTNASSTQSLPLVKTQDEYTDFHLQSERGVTTDSRSQPLNLLEEKITYEKMFYHIPKRKIKNAERERESLDKTTSRDFRFSISHGATADSSSLPYGFPISVGRGNWCTGLKQRVFN